MKFKKKLIDGLYIGELKSFKDFRGVFTRMYCTEIFKKKFGFNIKQINICSNPKKGTFRGLHYQIKNFKEDKVIQILEGETFHIVVDMRKKSKTYKKFITQKLNEKKKVFIVIPKGCAHGYLTLKKNTSIIYFTTNFYNKKLSRGMNINDPLLKKLKLPIKINTISIQDSRWQNIKF